MTRTISAEALGHIWDKKIDKAVKEHIEFNYSESDLVEFISENYPEAVTEYKEQLRQDAEESVEKEGELFTDACQEAGVDPDTARAWF